MPSGSRSSRHAGDLDAVRELADLISLSAQVHAENGTARRADLAPALWLAATVAVGAGSTDEHERAKEAVRGGEPEPPTSSIRSAIKTARQAGMGDALALAADSIGFAAEDVPHRG